MKTAVSSDSVSTSTRITDTTINMTRRRIEIQQDQSSISSLSYEIQGNDNTRVYLERKKQIRCIWCSRVNLIEKKTTMKCKECDRDFAEKRIVGDIMWLTEECQCNQREVQGKDCRIESTMKSITIIN